MKDISVKYIKKFLHVVLAVFLFSMFCLVLTNVVLRYGFSSSITWCDEASRYLFIWIIFIGGLIAFEENTHLGVDVVLQRLSIKGKRKLFIFNNIIVLFVLSLLIVGCYQYFQVTLEQRSPALDIPLALVYASGFVAAIGMALVTLNNLYLLFANKMSSAALVVTGTEDQAKIEEVLGEGPDKGDK